MLGRLLEIHRYPVKSLTGEVLDSAAVDLRGVVGDRLWSVRDPDGKLGSGKSSRRFRRMDGLLALSSRYDGETPLVAFPDGTELRGDDRAVHAALSAHVGRPVTLEREGSVSHFDEGPVHVVTTSALRAVGEVHGRPVDPRHLRPSLVLDTGDATGMVEEGWEGQQVRVGEVVLLVRYAMPRCVMVDLGQAGLPEDSGLLRSITSLNAGNLGVVADVVVGGRIQVGDPVTR